MANAVNTPNAQSLTQTGRDGKPREVVLKVRGLKKYFPISSGLIIQRAVGAVKAVDDVSIDVFRGEPLGLLGESGCAKAAPERTVLQLYRPTAGDGECGG